MNTSIAKAKVVVKGEKGVNVFGVNEGVIFHENRKLSKVYGAKKPTDLIY